MVIMLLTNFDCKHSVRWYGQINSCLNSYPNFEIIWQQGGSFSFFLNLILVEQKDAISTSHCSQPNNIEYDMAVEWCLLQERADKSWRKLYQV